VVFGVLALEAGVRAVPDAFLLPAHGWLGEYTYLGEEVIPLYERPRLLVFGTSRVKEGVSPGHVERAAGLPDRSVVNLGLRGGRPTDFLRLYEENHRRLRGAKVVLIGVDEWFFSPGFPLDPRNRMALAWGDRMRLTDDGASWGGGFSLEREKLILDGLVALRLRAPYVLKAVPMQLGLRRSRPQSLTPDRMVVSERRGADHLPNDFRLRQHYRDFDQSPHYVDHMRRLVTGLQADGLTVLLFQMPNRPDYQALVSAQEGEAFARHLQTTRDLAADLGVEFLEWHQAAACGLSPDDYLDYGHMQPEGAARFSEFLVEVLRSRDLLGVLREETR
jgi:hypothetical protein